MPDRFKTYSKSLEGPATHGFAVSPSDSGPLEEITRALYVGTVGDIALTLSSGATVTLANVPAGTVLPIRVSAVKATGTTAGHIVGLA